MSNKRPPKKSENRQHRFEQFEDRIVFSADGLLLANIDLADQPDERQQPAEIRPLLESTHEQTGLNYVVDEFALDGSGQTVAVIDSGIAWDHAAFGNGYGGKNQVVGGWDFAERDSNPYDDGPAGFHGTHVAGIVGSQHEQFKGVASGVDLVALRVFDDQGGGNIAWVEQALKWVHDHKDDFRNPITTVNLSLGTQWNANSVPNWATLEDEFKVLEEDGIFISVAAGNSFKQYNAVGVSYPASSSHVVPVASHDAQGEMSDFSQRNQRVLVAPGNSIKSAVPDHFFGGSSSDRFLGSSGTSMAAPYVAGASTLVRDAFEFMGFDEVDQGLIYRHFQKTADQIFDSITNQSYDKINLQRAIDAIITDAHGDSQQTAFDLGAIGSQSKTASGIMGGKSDVDWFKFRANASGEAVIQFSSVDKIDSNLFVAGSKFTIEGNKVRFQVEAGKEYRFSVDSEATLGHYQVNTRINQVSVAAQNVGQVVSKQLANQSVDGSRMYQMTASQTGVLTTQAVFGSGNNSAAVELYDSQMNLIGRGTSNGFQSRLDAEVTAGQKYFVRVTGQDAQFDLKLNNLVSVQNGVLNVSGTTGNDSVSIDLTNGIKFSVNGVGYQYDAQKIDHISVEGLQGADQLQVKTGQSDRTVLRNGQAVVHGADVTLLAKHFYSIDVTGQGSNDQVVFVDSAGNEFFTHAAGRSTMTSGGFRLSATGHAATQVLFSTGSDVATLIGSQGNDVFTLTDQSAWFDNSISQIFVRGWDHLNVSGGGGFDLANLNDSDGRDEFTLGANQSTRTSSGNTTVARNFDRVNAQAGEASDQVTMEGSSGDDRFVAEQNRSTLTNDQVTLVAKGFSTTIADVVNSTGHDRAVIFDSAGNDLVEGNHYRTRMTGDGRTIVAKGFDSVDVNSVNGGNDRGQLSGSGLAERFYFAGNAASLTSDQYQVRLVGFAEINVSQMDSLDSAYLRGSDGTDEVIASASGLRLNHSNSKLEISGFGEITIESGGGFDAIELDGFRATDRLFGSRNQIEAILGETRIRASDFVWLEATAQENSTARNDLQAVDFWFELHGDWE